jgi:hypothetical protein
MLLTHAIRQPLSKIQHLFCISVDCFSRGCGLPVNEALLLEGIVFRELFGSPTKRLAEEASTRVGG